MISTCKKCKRQFEMGVDGIYDPVDGRPVCDGCARVIRSPEGYAVLPGEYRGSGMLLQDVGTGDVRRIKGERHGRGRS